MISDGALLSLLVDDDAALLTLAAWGALKLKLTSIDEVGSISAIFAVSGLTEHATKRALAKLRACRVLIDGGISELADKMLQSRVQSRLGGKATKK